MCNLASASRHLLADTAPACIHGRAPECRQRATDAKETNDISLLCFHLAPNLVLGPGHGIRTIHQTTNNDSGPPAPVGSCASHWVHEQTVAFSQAGLAYIEKNAKWTPEPLALEHQSPNPMPVVISQVKHEDITSVCKLAYHSRMHR